MGRADSFRVSAHTECGNYREGTDKCHERAARQNKYSDSPSPNAFLFGTCLRSMHASQRECRRLTWSSSRDAAALAKCRRLLQRRLLGRRRASAETWPVVERTCRLGTIHLTESELINHAADQSCLEIDTHPGHSTTDLVRQCVTQPQCAHLQSHQGTMYQPQDYGPPHPGGQESEPCFRS